METGKNGVSAIVEHDYIAKESDELTLVKGAIISHIKIIPGGWWEGTLAANGKRGMFPDNFVRVLEPDDKNPVVLRDKSANFGVRRCKVVFSYQENNCDELSLQVGDIIEVLGEVEEGWWRGKLNGKIGVFPSNFVEIIQNASPISANRKSINNTSATTVVTANNLNSLLRNNNNSVKESISNSKEDLLSNASSHDSSYDAPSLPPKPVRELCKVLFAYEPDNEDELRLVEGDIITVLNKELPDKGWWKGELKGRIGVFPDNFVQLLPPEVTSPSKDVSKPDRPPSSAKATLMGNKQRKESFGSKDSLNDNSTANNTSVITRNTPAIGHVAAHRKSLEQKNELTIADKPPRKSLEIKNTGSSSDIRKSLESLDEKKGTPPPVTSKKPNVPMKKSPSVTSVTNNLFSSLKQKVKSVESKLSHDSADGAAGSKPGAQVADSTEKGVIGERIKSTDTEFDVVERSTMLQDPRASRAKAPKRRPPSSAEKLLPDSSPHQLNGTNNNNDHGLGHGPESPRHDHQSSLDTSANSTTPNDVELVKPKAREWEKHKAPWMEELKASQARKTSPGHMNESKTPEPIGSEDKVSGFDMAKSFSSSFVGGGNRDLVKQSTVTTMSNNTTTLEVRSHSVESKQPTVTINDHIMVKSTPVVGTRISINEKDSQNHIEKVMEPTSLRNRSISPIGRRPLNLPTSPLQQHKTATAAGDHGQPDADRVNDLEERVGKLEKVVTNQNLTIEDLRRQLADEAAKVKVLRMQLEKYAQCVTQV